VTVKATDVKGERAVAQGASPQAGGRSKAGWIDAPDSPWPLLREDRGRGRKLGRDGCLDHVSVAEVKVEVAMTVTRVKATWR
jgi:hypothetical protein